MTSRLLLDTQVALWWLTGHPRLNSEMQAMIANSECHLSAASVWEVAIKQKLGKLPISPRDFVRAAHEAGMCPLVVTHDHGTATAELPPVHNDPFDRLLIAQARIERLHLLTGNATLAGYGGDITVI